MGFLSPGSKYTLHTFWYVIKLFASIGGLFLTWFTAEMCSFFGPGEFCATMDEMFAKGLAAFATAYFVIQTVGGGYIAKSCGGSFWRGFFQQELPFVKYHVQGSSDDNDIAKLEQLNLTCSLGTTVITFVQAHLRFYYLREYPDWTGGTWDGTMTGLVVIGSLTWAWNSVDSAILVCSDKTRVALWEFSGGALTKALLAMYFAVSSAAHIAMFLVLASTTSSVFYPVVGAMMASYAVFMSIPFVSFRRSLCRTLVSGALDFPWDQTDKARSKIWECWRWVPSSLAVITSTTLLIVFGSLYAQRVSPSFFVMPDNKDWHDKRLTLGVVGTCLGAVNMACFLVIQLSQLCKAT
jgi:hypothetical protein